MKKISNIKYQIVINITEKFLVENLRKKNRKEKMWILQFVECEKIIVHKKIDYRLNIHDNKLRWILFLIILDLVFLWCSPQSTTSWPI